MIFKAPAQAVPMIGQDLIDRNAVAAETLDADRRHFLRRGAGVGMLAALGMMVPGVSLAEVVPAAVMGGREIRLANAHTGEKFSGTYWQNGRYLPDAFAGIKSVMRDHRSGEIFPIDPRLMDILYVLQTKMGSNDPYRVLSGYRSPKSNAMLRRNSEGVARQSLHMTGQAIDISLPGTPLSRLHKTAIAIHSGGVGYYPKTGFVHIDTGRVRSW